MSIYNLPPNKSFKKLVNTNPKPVQALYVPALQTQKQSTVNLSKLNSYKGKFSLTSKYNSRSTQNNNQSQKFESVQSIGKVNYMSETNKENIMIRANIMESDKMQKMKNEKMGHKQEEQQLEVENMKKIVKAASSFNLNNSKQMGMKGSQSKDKNIQNCKIQSLLNKDQLKQNAAKLVSEVQRRSKFHKYDNQSDDNQFLVIDEEPSQSHPAWQVPIQQPSKAQIANQKKPSLQKKPTSSQMPLKKQPQQRVHTETVKLSDLQASKLKDLEKFKKSQQDPLFSEIYLYEQSIKHITYTMIKMISLIGKLNLTDKRTETQEMNLKIMSQVKNQIFAIYSKELGKYIEKLNIREQIVAMAKQQEEFLKNSQFGVEKSQWGVEKSSEKNDQDNEISQQTNSMITEEESSSLLNSYEIHESFSQENGYGSDSLEREERSESQSIFEFEAIREIEIMPSGRNLLQTFNNQNLCNELQVIGNELIDELEESKKNCEGIKEGESNERNEQERNFRKKIIVSRENTANRMNEDTLSVYEENLLYGLRQIRIEEGEISEGEENPTQICRKLFPDPSALNSNPQNLSPINHLKSTTSLLSLQNQFPTQNQLPTQNSLSSQSQLPIHHQPPVHNQNSYPNLLPEHYYQVVSPSNTAKDAPTNYLQLSKGDTIKLLRKVDNNKWIAELDDRIGFVEQSVIFTRVRLLGITPKKNISD